MQFPRIFVVAGVLLSLIPIGLGIAAIATDQWVHTLSLTGTTANTTYSLWRCNPQTCVPGPVFKAAKALAIAGVVAIAVGAIVTLLFDVFIKTRWIQLIPLILLYLGPVALLIGLVLYILSVIDHGANLGQKLDKLGYSLILMLVSSLVGFLTAVYFAFATGIGIHRRQQVIRPLMPSPMLIEQITERF